MRYLGGKHRQASEIAQIIDKHRDGRSKYLEPFVGGGSVFSKVSARFDEATAGDAVPDLIHLWNQVSDGWEPPTTLSKLEWQSLRESQIPSAMRAWAGYAASYNGKWFAGYGPTASGRDYLAESHRGIMRKASSMHPNARFVAGDYSTHIVTSDTVVYCDPPYAGTETYGAADGFDHERFWNCVAGWSLMGALVLVHEYTAPADWTPVYARARVETMNHGGKSSGARTETIFIHRSHIAADAAIAQMRIAA